MKKAQPFLLHRAGWLLGLLLALPCGARAQSDALDFSSVIRIFSGQQTVRRVEAAGGIRVMDPAVASVTMDGENRMIVEGLRPGQTLVTYETRAGAPYAEQIVVMPPLTGKALEVYGLVADIPGIHVYEVNERVVLDGRLAAATDVDRIQKISESFGDLVLDLTVLDTGASNDVIADFIRRNAGIDGLVVSIFGETAYLRGTVPNEAARSNVVALAGTQIAKVMDMLTVRSSMIETEVLFLRVEKSKGHDWGMNLLDGGSGVSLNAGLDGSKDYANHVWSPVQLGISWSAALTPTLNALVSGGKAEVVARPRIGTRIGEKGRFLSGGEMYYKTSGEVSGDLESVEYGIELTVEPQFLLDSTLCNNIMINLSFPVAQSSGADLSLDKYTIESTVVCELGQSIVISGLAERINNEQNNKTPLLGDIPGIRLFFSNRQMTLKESELVAIITPRLLDAQLNQKRDDGAAAGIQAQREALMEQDARAESLSARAHARAKALADAEKAKAEAEAARASRLAAEEKAKADRVAAKERAKAEKAAAQERARQQKLEEKNGKAAKPGKSAS